ncbi:MAG: 30S ribosomal protein S12 methylthiotransferase RimO [candidate division WOR-3 bacterium]
MIKVYFIALGCPKNLVDTEKIMGELENKGAIIVSHLKESDVVILNTCGFIEPALRETRTEIKRLLKSKKKIFVYGCAVNRTRKIWKKEFPDVAGWYFIEERDQLIRHIVKKNSRRDARLLTTAGYAYLKIADGCSNHCSYCTIPFIKGPYKSIKFDHLLAEARALAGLGVKELILIAQDTARYGVDLYGKKMLVPLIREISQIDGIEWIRLLYLHPRSLDDEIIAEVRNNPKVCKYLEMPLQHINERLLKLMNRNITKREIIEKIEKLKGITLRTTVIVGFPSETEEEFKELYDFLKAGHFDWFGVFKYYREKETPAGAWEPLPSQIVNKRFSTMLNLQQKLIQEKNRRRLNKTYRVLIHGKNKYYIGHAEFATPEIDGQVIIKQTKVRIGDFYWCKIKGMNGADLYGV